MAKYSFRVEIEVNADTSPTDPTIGLTSGKFIWIAGDSFNYSSSLKGILSEDFADSITKSIQVDRMGDVANIDGLNLKIKNTSKFWVQFITAFGENASLHGSKVTIYEMVDNGLGGSTSTILYVGYCDLPSFDKSTYKIPVRGSGDVRTAYLTKPITDEFFAPTSLGIIENSTDEDAIGKILPITFGENSKAYFLKTGNKETLGYSVDDFSVNYAFPVFSKVNSSSYAIDLFNSSSTTFSYNIPSLINGGRCFLKVIEGTGSGELCLISSYSVVTNDRLIINLERPFSVEGGLVANDSIVQFVEILNQYNGDFWQCGGYYKNGVASPYNQDIYRYDKGFSLIPSKSIESDNSNSLNNTLIESPDYYQDDKLIGFEFVQESKANRLFADQATYWFGSSYTYFNALGCLVPSGSSNQPSNNKRGHKWRYEPTRWARPCFVGCGYNCIYRG